MFAFQFFLTCYHRSLWNTCQIRNTNDFITLPDPIIRDIRTPESIITQRLAELRIIINGIIGTAFSITPSATVRSTLHPALNRIFIYHLHILNCRSTAHSACQVDLNTRLFIRRESKPQYSTMGCSTSLCFDLIISQLYRVISRFRSLGSFIIGRTVSFDTVIILFTRYFQQFTGGRHDEEVS